MRLFNSTILAPVVALCLTTSVAVGRGAPDSFADLAEKLLPGVVNIATTQTVKTRDRPGIPGMPPEFDEFMRRFQERQGQGGGGSRLQSGRGCPPVPTLAGAERVLVPVSFPNIVCPFP